MVQADIMLLELAMAAEEATGKPYWQAIVAADEPVPAHRSVVEPSVLLGSTDPRPARSLNVVAEATSGLRSPFFVAPVDQQTVTAARSSIWY